MHSINPNSLVDLGLRISSVGTDVSSSVARFSVDIPELTDAISLVAKDPSRFGTGAIEGVTAPKAANNATAQTAFVPTLTLGIPGDATIALILGFVWAPWLKKICAELCCCPAVT